MLFGVRGRRGSVASSEVCSSGVASRFNWIELSPGTTTGIQSPAPLQELTYPQLEWAGCRFKFQIITENSRYKLSLKIHATNTDENYYYKLLLKIIFYFFLFNTV